MQKMIAQKSEGIFINKSAVYYDARNELTIEKIKDSLKG